MNRARKAYVHLIDALARACAIALLVILAIFCIAPAKAAQVELGEFSATYAAAWNGMGLGKIEVRLEKTSPNCFEYSSKTKPIGLVKLFYGKPEEVSEFCVRNGEVVPKKFRYEAKKDSFSLDFNWKLNKVFGGIGVGERDLPADAQDRFGLQQAVRYWLIKRVNDRVPVRAGDEYAFSLVDDDRIKNYKLEVTGYETVTVPEGSFDAIRLERTDDPNRIARFWVAAARDYMPVKVETGKDGKVQLSMELTHFVHKQPVRAASPVGGTEPVTPADFEKSP